MSIFRSRVLIYGGRIVMTIGVIVMVAGCTTPTKYPSDWKPALPVQSAQDITGEYYDDCEMVHGKRRSDTDLARHFGATFEDSYTSKSVRIEPLSGRRLLLTFVQPFGEQRIIKIKYSIKDKWIKFGDYDVALRAEGGEGAAIAWLHGQRDNIYLRRDEDGNLIVLHTEREDLFFVFVQPVADEWYLRCQLNGNVKFDLPVLRSPAAQSNRNKAKRTKEKPAQPSTDSEQEAPVLDKRDKQRVRDMGNVL